MRTIGWTRATAPALLVSLALVGGCATGPRQLETQVTSYNEWSTLPGDRSYVFARTLEYQNSLELKQYEDVVRDELAIQGFRLATDPARANLTVTLRPSVSSTRIRVRDPFYGDPFWRYGGYGWYGRRSFGWYDPFWSSPFGSPFGGYGDVDVFRRRLEIDIDSKNVAGKRYYEGRAESSGQSDSLQSVVPYLVRAIFSDFPGNNGQTRRVDVPIEAAAPTGTRSGAVQ